MINNMINGFCMAIADSVPGVSGGTIAYIMGFYQKLVDSVHDLFGKDREKRNVAARYLIKLGIGWAVGFLSAMLVLAAMFAKNIYFMSSLFLGLSIAALPFIIHSERKVIAGKYLNIVYTFLGFAIVAGLTLLKNSGHIGLSVNFHDAGAVDLIYVFIAGVIAITAMILPGISGSTMLLIMGVYLQAVEGIHEVLTLDFSSLPSMICLAAGILFGIIFSMNLISRAFKRFRCQMVYLIIGLLIGSFVAIVYGPTTLPEPLPVLDMSNFSIAGLVLGAAILLAFEILTGMKKKKMEQAGQSVQEVQNTQNAGAEQYEQNGYTGSGPQSRRVENGENGVRREPFGRAGCPGHTDKSAAQEED